VALCLAAACTNPKPTPGNRHASEHTNEFQLTPDTWDDTHPDALFLSQLTRLKPSVAQRRLEDFFHDDDFALIDMSIQRQTDTFGEREVFFLGIDLEELRTEGKMLMFEFRPRTNEDGEHSGPHGWEVGEDVFIFSHGHDQLLIFLRKGEWADWEGRFQRCTGRNRCEGKTYRWSPHRDVTEVRPGHYFHIVDNRYYNRRLLGWMEQ
jgi:hypothetical protein